MLDRNAVLEVTFDGKLVFSYDEEGNALMFVNRERGHVVEPVLAHLREATAWLEKSLPGDGDDKLGGS